MRTLSEIAGDVRDLLLTKFRTVRISSLQTSDQLLKEIKAVNPDKLPGVIIVFDRWEFDGFSRTSTAHLTLVLVGEFRAGSDERALSAFAAAADLMALFPAEGREVAGTYLYPSDCVSATPDAQYAVLAVGIEVKQG